VNVDKKLRHLASKKCLLTSVNLTACVLFSYVHFSEKGHVGFSRLSKGSMEQDRLRTTALEETSAPSFRFADTHGGSRVLQNMGNFLPGCTVSHQRRQYLHCQISKYINTRDTKKGMMCKCSFLAACAPFACIMYFHIFILYDPKGK